MPKNFKTRTLWHVARIAVFGGLVGLTMGMNCNPGGGTPGCFDCLPGSVRGCGNACVPELGLGALCSTDMCSLVGRCGGTLICGEATGRCIAGLPLLAACVPSAKNPCAQEGFCKKALCEPGGSLGSHCADTQKEGQECDSQYGSPKCTPCEPGLACVLDPTTKVARCRTACSTAADCPCGRGLACSATSLSAANICCNGDGVACVRQADCCGPGEVRCLAELNGARKCGACRPTGETCSDRADCCDPRDGWQVRLRVARRIVRRRLGLLWEKLL